MLFFVVFLLHLLRLIVDPSKKSDLYIVFGSKDDEIYVVDMNGNSYPGWPILVNGNIEGSIICSDLDGNGEVEIVANTDSGEMFVFNLDGSLHSGFPINSGAPFFSSPIILDLDEDGDLESKTRPQTLVDDLVVEVENHFSSHPPSKERYERLLKLDLN